MYSRLDLHELAERACFLQATYGGSGHGVDEGLDWLSAEVEQRSQQRGPSF